MDGKFPSSENVRLVFATLQEQGRSTTWLAKQMGWSANYLYQIRSGRKPATLKFYRLAARALALPEAVFLFGLDFRERKEESLERESELEPVA